MSAFRTQKGFFEGLILRLVAVKRNCSIELQDVLVRAGDFNEPIRLGVNRRNQRVVGAGRLVGAKECGPAGLRQRCAQDDDRAVQFPEQGDQFINDCPCVGVVTVDFVNDDDLSRKTEGPYR